MESVYLHGTCNIFQSALTIFREPSCAYIMDTAVVRLQNQYVRIEQSQTVMYKT